MKPIKRFSSLHGVSPSLCIDGVKCHPMTWMSHIASQLHEKKGLRIGLKNLSYVTLVDFSILILSELFLIISKLREKKQVIKSQNVSLMIESIYHSSVVVTESIYQDSIYKQVNRKCNTFSFSILQ